MSCQHHVREGESVETFSDEYHGLNSGMFVAGSMRKGGSFFDLFRDRRARTVVLVIGHRGDDGKSYTMGYELPELFLEDLKDFINGKAKKDSGE